jgi:capsular exopolysaccharide synthesis family protein
VANVWDAMKKHEQERGAGAPAPAPAPDPVASPTPAGVRGVMSTAAAQVAAAPAVSATVTTALPLVTPNGYSLALVAHHDRGGAITEEYRALRTNLLAQYDDERFCLLVTSAEAGEGKTVSTVNFALVLAERQERRTVIIDGDLRKRTIASLLHIDNAPGLSDVLRGTKRIGDVVRATAYPNLFVVPAGQSKQAEVGEILGRPELEEAVAELRRTYDYVLIDTPPITIASDAGMLGRATREALVVVRMNKTRRESVDRAIGLLHAANVKPVGMILTHQRYYIPNYLYRYS